jgi:hypothetical protein
MDSVHAPWTMTSGRSMVDSHGGRGGGVAERPGDGSEGDDDGGARRDLSWRRERGNGVRQNVPGYGGSLL